MKTHFLLIPNNYRTISIHVCFEVPCFFEAHIPALSCKIYTTLGSFQAKIFRGVNDLVLLAVPKITVTKMGRFVSTCLTRVKPWHQTVRTHAEIAKKCFQDFSRTQQKLFQDLTQLSLCFFSQIFADCVIICRHFSRV